jgi:hypothetical protein
MEELIANQPHTDTLLGNFKACIWKNCELVPVNHALYEVVALKGPVAWDVGEDAEAVRSPVTPDVSRRSSPGLNV